MKTLTIIIISLLIPAACEAQGQPPPDAAAESTRRGEAEPPRAPQREAAPLKRERYAWLDAMDDLELISLHRRFPTPEGFRRVRVEPGSFAEFLRGLPIRTDRTRVRAHDGRRLRSPAAAIVAMDVGERNLQQCADSAIRLHAEWLWSRDGEAAYHFTSGDRSAWSDWQDGERFRIEGSRVTRSSGPARRDSHETFRQWLNHTFMYAGTRSLKYDSRPVEPGEIRPGDFFVAPGSPGHAVVVLDVAAASSGRRIALLGQGFMPAQEFHVLKKSGAEVVEDVWFLLPGREGDMIETPSWRPFSATQVRRFDPP